MNLTCHIGLRIDKPNKYLGMKCYILWASEKVFNLTLFTFYTFKCLYSIIMHKESGCFPQEIVDLISVFNYLYLLFP